MIEILINIASMSFWFALATSGIVAALIGLFIMIAVVFAIAGGVVGGIIGRKR